MGSRQFVDSQTKAIDSLLAELTHSESSMLINFNNTKQLDALLLHLELSLLADTFCAIPSKTVIHILFTLAARCSQSHWSNGSNHSQLFSESSEYMKQVNAHYDAALDKSSLQHRSASILQSYLDLVVVDSPDLAIQTLYLHLGKVCQSFVKTDILNFFQRLRNRTPTAQAEIVIPSESVKNVVEVISDSEGSDSLLDVSLPIADSSHILQPELPHRSVSSLSEMGSKLSGLGETATLFKDMPHLSSHATPEPDEPKTKKAKTNPHPWLNVQVFDDFLLVKKLESVENYNIWNLVKWTFWCANTSSQYQSFLFNSMSTNVHHIYKSYENFLCIFFRFCGIQLSRTTGQNTLKNTIIDSLLLNLGPKSNWKDRTAEFIFSGLKIPSNEKPQPCYTREVIMINHDPTVEISQCKTNLEFDDNMSSMKLRVLMLCTFFTHEIILEGKHESGTVDWYTSLEGKKYSLLWYSVEKLTSISLPYLDAFFNALCVCEVRPIQCPYLPENLCFEITFSLLRDVTGGIIRQYKRNEPNLVEDIACLISEEQIYSSVTRDLTIDSLQSFLAKWERLIFLLEQIFDFVLCHHFNTSTHAKNVMQAASQADEMMKSAYTDYLQSKFEFAEIIEDARFTLSQKQIDEGLLRLQCRFSQLASSIVQH